MIFQRSQLSCPLTAFSFFGTIHLITTEHSFQSLVGEAVKFLRLTTGAGAVQKLYPLDALLTETIPTAAGLVWLT